MTEFHLERSISINAPAGAVFSNVKEFRNWTIWSPWVLAEPHCSLDYAADGKSYSWSGDIIGSGEMEMLDTVENKEVHYRLTFLKPFKSTSYVSFFFDESNWETNTRWTMSGSLPFFLFWMKKTMVAAIEMDYDRGLRMLKDHVELGLVPSKLKFGGLETVEGFEYFGMSRECSLSEIGNLMPADMQKLGSIFHEAGIEVVGAPVCYYEKYKVSSGMIYFTVALPVAAGTPCPQGLRSGKQPTRKFYAIHHTGAYRHLANAWAAGIIHQRAKLFKQRRGVAAFEYYRNDPTDVSEEELEASVYFPV